MADPFDSPPPIDPGVPHGKLGRYKCPECSAPMDEHWSGTHRSSSCSVGMQLSERKRRLDAADAEVRELGYVLHVEKTGGPAPITHEAWVNPDLQQATTGRHLTYSTSRVEAAEAAVPILRGIVQRDDPWPQLS